MPLSEVNSNCNHLTIGQDNMSMTASHQRIFLFMSYATIAFVVSAVFATAGHESAFAPMCVFYPWVRLLIEYGVIPETKIVEIPFTTAYILLLFLSGSLTAKFSKPKLFLCILFVHLLGIFLTIVLIRHDLLSLKRLASWSYTISIPLSFGYYFYDFKLLQEMNLKDPSLG
jgi:hypothetical protein